MESWKYDLVGIGYSMQCPNTRQFTNKVRIVTRRDKAENEKRIDGGFEMFSHEFLYHGERFMIKYSYYDFGYQASVYPCTEPRYHSLRN